MKWTLEKAKYAARVLGYEYTLGMGLERMSKVLHEDITEGALKGVFNRHGLGGVREKVATNTAQAMGQFPASLRPRSTPKPSSTPKGPKLYVVLSDVHVPYHDSNCLDAVAALMKDLTVHGLVLNGDFLDLLELSSHSAQSLAKLENRRVMTTFSEGNALLDQLLKAGGATCTDNHFIDGNHEDRIHRWLASGDHGVFAGDELLSIAPRLKFKERGIKYAEGYPDAGIDLGKLWVTHGRFTPKYHANKMLDYYRHSVMYGHTHTPQVHHASALHGQQVAIGTGYLAEPNSEAMSYAPRPNSWVQGFALVYVYPDGAFNAQPINFWKGQFTYAGKTYGRRKAGK